MGKLVAYGEQHKIKFAAGYMLFAAAIFYPIFFAVYLQSSIVSGFLAIALALAFASIRGEGHVHRMVRYSSIPMLGAAILSRTEYWTEELIGNFIRLLSFTEPLGATELMATSSHWWFVGAMGLAFVCYYKLIERWPSKKPRSGTATAISAAMQIVIFTSVAFPTVATIGISMLLGGVIITTMTGKFTPINVAFFVMAPLYTMANDGVSAWLFLLSGLTVLLLFTVYPVSPRMTGTYYGIGYFLTLAPLCYLANDSDLLLVVSISLVSGIALALKIARVFPNTVAVEYSVLLLGLWMLVISFPQPGSILLPLAGMLLIPLMSTVSRDAHHPLRLYYKTVYLWFLYITLLPHIAVSGFLPPPESFFTPLWLGLLAVTAFVFYDKLIVKALQARA